MSIISKAADYYLTYRFLKALVTPFKDTKAYELGIVDEKGKILKQMKDLTSDQEKKAYGYFERMVWNIKKIMEKIPFLGSRLGTVVSASLLLLKEERDIDLKEFTFLKYVYEDLNFLLEKITPQVLNDVEKYADKLFARVGIDVEFTRHFLDRVNDPRNKKEITSAELIRLFRETYKTHGKKISELGDDAQAVITDMKTDVNMPFVLTWDSNSQEFDLVAKTVMRKRDFKTSNLRLAVETPVNSVGSQNIAGLEHDPKGPPVRPKKKRKKKKKKRKKFIDFIRR